MDSAATIVQGRPLSESVRQHRITNNLCMYCGGENHIVRNCKEKLKGKQVASSLVATILEEQNSYECYNSAIPEVNISCITVPRPHVIPIDPNFTPPQTELLHAYVNALTRKDTTNLSTHFWKDKLSLLSFVLLIGI